MGTCISKCKPTTEEFIHPIQVKLVISHSPSLPTVSTPKNPSKNQLSPPSCSPTSSTSTTSSSVGTSTITTSSTSPSISKDRSFSNEFLWSCIKENPHIIQVDLSPLDLGPTKASIRTTQELRSKTNVAAVKQPVPRCTQLQPTQIARQKSSREETERRSRVSLPRRNVGTQSPSRRFNGATCRDPSKNPVAEGRNHGATYRGLSSSPSRRFNGATCQDPLKIPVEEGRNHGATYRGLSPSPSGRFNGGTCRDPLKNPAEEGRSHGATYRGLSPSPSRRFNGQDLPKNPQDETCKHTIARRGLSKSPSRKLNGNASKSIARDQLESCERGFGFTGNADLPVTATKENIRPTSSMHQIKSQIDQNVLEDAVSDQESNSLPMEDIDNPLISLDCFIFL